MPEAREAAKVDKNEVFFQEGNSRRDINKHTHMSYKHSTPSGSR